MHIIVPGYLISHIYLGINKEFRISSDNLCKFYYTFRMTKQRVARNTVGAPFNNFEFRGLFCYEPTLYSSKIFVCLFTLAIDDGLAMEVAQQNHINLLRIKAEYMWPKETI